MNVTKVSKKGKGKKYVSNSPNVSVLQAAVRCLSRTRSRSRRSKRNNDCDGSCTSCVGYRSGRNNHRTGARKGEFNQSRVTLPTRGGNDRGETSTQTVLIVPVVLSVLFVSVHLAVLSHARHIALVAAQSGAEIAASADGSNEILMRAREQSLRTVKELGGHLAEVPHVVSTSALVGMQINLEIVGIVPFLPTHVVRTVWVSREQFILEQDR